MLQTKSHLYIDQRSKAHHKDLFIDLDQLLDKYHLKLLEDISLTDEVVVGTILISDDFTRSGLTELLKQNLVFAIKIDQPNLSMFQDEHADEKVFLIKDRSDFIQAIETINFLVHQYNLSYKNKVISESRRYLTSLFSRKQIENYDYDKEMLENLEHKLYEQETPEAIQKIVQDYSQELAQGDIKLYHLEEYLLAQNKRQNPVLPLRFFGEDFLFLTWSEERSGPYVAALYCLLEEYFGNKQLVYETQEQLLLWEDIFSSLTLPIAIFDEQGELVIHNSEFGRLKLGQKDCEMFTDKQQITIQGSVYRVLISKVLNRFTEYIFVIVDDFIVGNSQSSSQELGIISSSIAHEINNPLAGILAAIDFLLLDDLGPEMEQELREMKKGINRCKKLISTFLGFSQMKAAERASVSCRIKDCVDQAIELIRFRLVENNLQLQVEHENEGAFQPKVNPHILSMIFYLVLGDFVTHLSHHKLVAQKSHNQFKIKLKESKEGINWSFPEGIDLTSGQISSKLMNHLFETINFDHRFDKRTLMIFHGPTNG